ncbi:hypothetical protein N acetyltransferase GCN5 [Aspergillus fumigatus]|nr:hypothetical protein N acetyltransferase GCN5 [Aspergillus fumigatus]
MEFLDDPRGVIRAEDGRPGERIRKGIPALRQRLGDATARPDCHVQQPDRSVRQVAHRVDSMRLARDDLDRDAAVVDLHDRDLARAEVAVPRLAHLQLLGQVNPQLQADVGAAVGVLAGHLGVHDAAAGGHELQVAWANGAFVPGKIFVVDAT